MQIQIDYSKTSLEIWYLFMLQCFCGKRDYIHLFSCVLFMALNIKSRQNIHTFTSTQVPYNTKWTSNSGFSFAVLSTRLLPLPAGGLQRPPGSPWPRHAALFLPVAPPDGPRLAAGAPHGVAAARVPRPTGGVRLHHPRRHTPHHIVSFISCWENTECTLFYIRVAHDNKGPTVA